MKFPVWADETLALLRHLLKVGIESGVFWDLTHPAAPMASFPFEDVHKRRCIEIPVRQCLGGDDMAIITRTLNNWNATSTPAKSVGV